MSWTLSSIVIVQHLWIHDTRTPESKPSDGVDGEEYVCDAKREVYNRPAFYSFKTHSIFIFLLHQQLHSSSILSFQHIK